MRNEQLETLYATLLIFGILSFLLYMCVLRPSGIARNDNKITSSQRQQSPPEAVLRADRTRSTQPGRELSPPPLPLQVLSEKEALRHKDNGSRFFADKDYPSALRSYRKALAYLPSELCWPREELLALTLHSNVLRSSLFVKASAAATTSRTGMSKGARTPRLFDTGSEHHERKGAGPPCGGVARLERCCCCQHKNGRKEQDNKLPPPPSNAQIWSVLEQGRVQGYLSSGQTTATRRKFLQLGARMWDTKKGQQRQHSAITGLHAWTDHFVRSGLVTVQKAAQARLKVQQKQKEHADSSSNRQASKQQEEVWVLQVLDELLPKPKFKVGQVCRLLISSILRRAAFPVENTVAFLRKCLLEDGLHVSQTDTEGGSGYLLWAICYGLSECPPEDEEATNVFLLLLSVLVDEFHVPVDQRATEGLEMQSRNPLQYVAKSARPRAVRAMLDRGAKVNLRDDDGWTPLSSLCMDTGLPPEKGADRIEVARMLCDAGADLEAVALSSGYTPLLVSCIQPCAPLVAFLLQRGANRHYCSPSGFTAIGMAVKMDQKASAEEEKCLELLCQNENDKKALKREVKAVEFDKLIDVMVSASDQVTLSPTVSGVKGLLERAEQELAILSALFRHLGMDPGVLCKPMSPQGGNWLEEFYQRVYEHVPESFSRLYCEETPREADLALMLSHSSFAFKFVGDDGFTDLGRAKALSCLFRKFRDRGIIYWANMENFLTTHCVAQQC